MITKIIKVQQRLIISNKYNKPKTGEYELTALIISLNKHTVVVYYEIPNWFIPLRPRPFANIYDDFFFVS